MPQKKKKIFTHIHIHTHMNARKHSHTYVSHVCSDIHTLAHTHTRKLRQISMADGFPWRARWFSMPCPRCRCWFYVQMILTMTSLRSPSFTYPVLHMHGKMLKTNLVNTNLLILWGSLFILQLFLHQWRWGRFFFTWLSNVMVHLQQI